MPDRIARRDFLKAAPVAAAGALAIARTRDVAALQAKPADVRIGAVSYAPLPDYPIQPKRYSDVTLKDQFWKPKVDLNAAVTIPFEMQKLTEGGRGLDGGVLEAAILTLRTH